MSTNAPLPACSAIFKNSCASICTPHLSQLLKDLFKRQAGVGEDAPDLLGLAPGHGGGKLRVNARRLAHFHEIFTTYPLITVTCTQPVEQRDQPQFLFAFHGHGHGYTHKSTIEVSTHHSPPCKMSVGGGRPSRCPNPP